MTIESPVPDQKPEAAAAPAARPSFFRRRSGKIALAASAVVLLAGGVAVAQSGRHGGGMMGGMGGMMGGRGVERLCALDVNFVSQRMADRLAERLTLTDAQKPALNELRQSFATAASEAKPTVCASGQTRPANAIERLDRAQKGMAAATTVMAAVKPKLEAFYARLDDTQKKTFDEMGQRGMRGEGRGRGEHRGEGRRGEMRGHGEGGQHRWGMQRGEDGERGGRGYGYGRGMDEDGPRGPRGEGGPGRPDRG